MATQTTDAIEVFYSYAHGDEALKNELVKHLANLERQGVITGWHDRKITAGQEWAGEIDEHLNSARVILLLISPDFMFSNYCNDIEVRRAMERHEAGEARVIPVILRAVDWDGAPFSKLQALPTDAKPVTLWNDRDEAFLTVVKEIRRALKELSSQNNVPPLLNVPRPPIVGFVARRDRDGRDIVERLKEELAPQNNHLVALWGEGGIGKTTLAAEAVRAVQEIFAQRIVWISADGRPDFSLSTLLDEIATQLRRNDLRALPIGEKELQVSALISTAKTLIVLDNFETIAPAEQTRCTKFLAQRTPWPALITSRQKVAGARDVLIDAMSPEEATLFLQKLVEQSPIPQVFTEQVRGRISETATRNPLVMEWVVAQINLAQQPDDVLNELAQGKGDAAARVFDRSFGLEQLGDDGRAALLALSLFVPDASRPALSEVAGFGADIERLKGAVKQIAALRLVSMTADGSRLYIAGLTRELSKARLAKDARAAEFRQRFVAYFQSYAEAHAQPTPEDYDALEAEKDNLLSTLDTAFTLGRGDSVIKMAHILTGGVNGMLSVRGYWNEVIRYAKQALDVAKVSGNEWFVGALANNLGSTYAEQGDYRSAKEYYELAVQVARKIGAEQGLSATLHELGRLAQAEREFEEARRLYNESLEIDRRRGYQGGIARSLSELGRLAHAEGEIEEARRLYNESLTISKKFSEHRASAVSLHNLATIAQIQGELEEARRLFNESLKIKQWLGNQSGIAITLWQLGLLAAQEDDSAEAARLLREALSIFQRLKSPNAEFVRRNLAEIEGESS